MRLVHLLNIRYGERDASNIYKKKYQYNKEKIQSLSLFSWLVIQTTNMKIHMFPMIQM